MGIFDWLKPEEEPEDHIVGEISNDSGDHIVFNVSSEDEGLVRRIMRENNVNVDRDDQLSRQYNAARKVEQRNPDQYRYRMEKVVDRSENLEPEEDDDTITEGNEQPAKWWPF